MFVLHNNWENEVKESKTGFINYKSILVSVFYVGIIGLVSQNAMAITLGDMASSITATFTNVGYLITAASYIAGLAFSIGAIMKFKAHKDNPTQVPIGTPIALVFVAASLLFLPTILDVTSQTMFGGEGETAGPEGKTIGEQ